jgi:predicted acyltransferase
MSIDALRGFDMFWIVGGDKVFLALVALFVSPIPAAVKEQMTHVPWEGFVAWDLIMPLFLFIVGAAMPFAFAKRVQPDRSKLAVYPRILVRVLVLWVFGMIVQGNLLAYDPSNLYLFSNTLQTIAVGYLVASIALLHLPLIGQVGLTASLLLGYWLIMTLAAVPGHPAGMMEEKLNFARYVDQVVLGPFHREAWNYTWVLSSMSFAATVLLGVHAGQILRCGRSQAVKVLALVGLGLGCLAAGWLWSHWFPINKRLFTSSMVLWAGGWSYLLLALFYLVIDVAGFRRWSFFFVVIGANAIAAYMLTHVPGFRKIWYEIVDVFTANLTPCLGACQESVQHVGAFALLWLLLFYLYRKKSFLRV